MIAEYHPGHDDAILLAWYTHLVNTRDLYAIAARVEQDLHGFFSLFKRCETVLALDDDALIPWAVCWVEEFTTATRMINIWIDQPRRRTLAAGRFLVSMHTAILDAYDTVLGVTRNPVMIELAEHLGYTYHGEVPGVCDGQPGLLFSHTKEAWHGQRRRRHPRSTRTTTTDSGRNGTDRRVDRADASRPART